MKFIFKYKLDLKSSYCTYGAGKHLIYFIFKTRLDNIFVSNTSIKKPIKVLAE